MGKIVGITVSHKAWGVAIHRSKPVYPYEDSGLYPVFFHRRRDAESDAREEFARLLERLDGDMRVCAKRRGRKAFFEVVRVRADVTVRHMKPDSETWDADWAM